jgi:hypothetical protein
VLDLTELLFRQRSIPRGDELLSHVADLTSCLRATAYRRRGHKPDPFTKNKLSQFAIGRGYELSVAADLIAAGHDVKQNLEVEVYGLVGHPDLFVDDEWLIECKTTDWSTPRSDVTPAHAIQASAYSIALPQVQFTSVLTKYGADFRNPDKSHVEREYPVNPVQYRAFIEEQAPAVVAATDPNAPLPAAEPSPLNVNDKGENWECRYCAWRLCPAHPRHDPALVEEAIPS